MQNIEIMRHRSGDQRAVDGMECDALLGRVRRRLALMQSRQFVLRVRERVQLRCLLRKQYDKSEKQAPQCAPAWIWE